MTDMQNHHMIKWISYSIIVCVWSQLMIMMRKMVFFFILKMAGKKSIPSSKRSKPYQRKFLSERKKFNWCFFYGFNLLKQRNYLCSFTDCDEIKYYYMNVSEVETPRKYKHQFMMLSSFGTKEKNLHTEYRHNFRLYEIVYTNWNEERRRDAYGKTYVGSFWFFQIIFQMQKILLCFFLSTLFIAKCLTVP